MSCLAGTPPTAPEKVAPRSMARVLDHRAVGERQLSPQFSPPKLSPKTYSDRPSGQRVTQPRSTQSSPNLLPVVSGPVRFLILVILIPSSCTGGYSGGSAMAGVQAVAATPVPIAPAVPPS